MWSSIPFLRVCMLGGVAVGDHLWHAIGGDSGCGPLITILTVTEASGVLSALIPDYE